MKKSVRVISPLLLMILLFASCDPNRDCVKGKDDSLTRELVVEPFTSVDLATDFDLLIIPDSFYKVEVTGQFNILDLINPEVVNGTWRIQMDDCYHKALPVSMEIHMPVPRTITASGSGTITIADTLRANTLSAVVTGSGGINLLVNAEQLVCANAGSGDIVINGQADFQTSSIGGSGNIKSYGLNTDVCSMVVTGSGNAEVWVNNSLNVNISGSGNVYYKGNPSVISTITGTGSVIDAN